MNADIDALRDKIVQLRRELRALEARRSAMEADIPSELLHQLVQTSHALEKAEAAAWEAAQGLAEEINHIRDRIRATLDQYNRWRTQMLEVEKTFLTRIVRPGYHLRQAVHTRSRLERERQRITQAIESESYPDQSALEADIRETLLETPKLESLEAETDEAELPPDAARLIAFKDLDADLLAEAFEKEHVVQEFRRIVFPAVHPDTSDTDAETYLVVREVYDNRDYLLMQAYTAHYRGEIQPQQAQEDRLATLDAMLVWRDEYQSVLTRLTQRIQRLKDELTLQEVEDPEALRDLLTQRSEEILARIQKEAERIQTLRDEIAALAEAYDQSRGA